MFKHSTGRKRQEGIVIDQIAARQSQLAQTVAPGQQGRYRLVTNLVALVKVDLENIWAMLGE